MKITIEGTEAEITGFRANMGDQLQKTVELERAVRELQRYMLADREEMLKRIQTEKRGANDV